MKIALKGKYGRGKSFIIDEEDFDRINQHKWYLDSKGYVTCQTLGSHKFRRRLFLHRFIMNTPEGFETDHIDLNPLNNRKSNLRNATSNQNKANRKVQFNNSLGYKNIFYKEIKMDGKLYPYYIVNIGMNGKRFRFYKKTLKEAIEIRNQKLKEIQGEFAHL